MLMQTEVKAVAELIPGLSDSRGRARNWIVLVSGSPFPFRGQTGNSNIHSEQRP